MDDCYRLLMRWDEQRTEWFVANEECNAVDRMYVCSIPYEVETLIPIHSYIHLTSCEEEQNYSYSIAPFSFATTKIVSSAHPYIRTLMIA